MNATATYDLSSERICGPEDPDSSHIVSHHMELVGTQIELLWLRSA
jgi:hypothetical protein